MGADEMLTDALARWTASLWKPQQRLVDGLVPVFYIDGLCLAVYTDHLIPRRLVERLEKVLGCRVLVVLHDQEGHLGYGNDATRGSAFDDWTPSDD